MAPVEQGEDAAGRPSEAGLFARLDGMLARHRAEQPPTATTPGSGLTNTPGSGVYGQINVYGVTTKSERHKRSYWTRTADGNGIGGRKAPVPYGS